MNHSSEMKEHDSEAPRTKIKRAQIEVEQTISLSLSAMREFEYIDTGLLLYNLDRIGEYG